MSLPKIEVKEIAAREFGLYVKDNLIGTSKLHCDAQMQKHFLDELFQKVAADYSQGARTPL